jgi:flagellar biosynthetic protein FlhB
MSVLLVGTSSLFIFGSMVVQSILTIMENNFTISREAIFTTGVMFTQLTVSTYDAMMSLVPIFMSLFVISIIAPMAVGGWIFSPQALSFKFDKLDPIKGLKRVMGPNGLMELVKALAKFLVVSVLAMTYLWFKLDDLMMLGQNGLTTGLVDAASFLFGALFIFSASTILIALVDVPFQLWQHTKQLKMTKQEIKDEFKETEGKPEVKAQLRDKMQQLANQRMLEKVPEADVVITNPTHFAVALNYDQENGGAPQMVAKGIDHMAERIKSIAASNDVTVFSSPLLARALYFNTKVGQEIPAGLYLAVAQILAYVYQLKAVAKDRRLLRPKYPQEISIPDEYKKY